MTVEQLIEKLKTLDQSKNIKVVSVEGYEFSLETNNEISIDEYESVSHFVDNFEADRDFYVIN